jgi:cysteinyl-tRNA synthetase
LWKPSEKGQVGWDSPWGFGRPGWHIECSAMAGSLLGETFDIHGGGIDLIFPHHENEIAQSSCAYGKPYVNYWLHNGFLQINGAKMSKSEGNFFTVADLLHKKSLKGELIKFILLKTHYRQPLDWTDNAIDEAESILDRWFRKIECVKNITSLLPEKVKICLMDDLNIPAAITEMHHLSEQELANSLHFFGFRKTKKHLSLSEFEIKNLIEERQIAKKNKNYPQADKIRMVLEKNNILIEDTTNGTTWRPK